MAVSAELRRRLLGDRGLAPELVNLIRAIDRLEAAEQGVTYSASSDAYNVYAGVRRLIWCRDAYLASLERE